MKALWIAALIVVGLVVGVAKTVMGGMLREEAQTRLNRIPYALLRLATARVPADLRDDLAAEWNAELEFVLTGTDGLPLTRLARGIRYSAGLLLSARDITDGLTHGSGRRVAQRIQFAIGVSLAGIGMSGASSGVFTAILAAINPRPGQDIGVTGSVAVACVSLSMLCMGIGIASGKPRAFSPIGAGLTAIAGFIALYLDHGAIRFLVWAAMIPLLALAAAILAIRMRRHPRQARAIHNVLFPGCTECFPVKAAGQGQGPATHT